MNFSSKAYIPHQPQFISGSKARSVARLALLVHLCCALQPLFVQAQTNFTVLKLFQLPDAGVPGGGLAEGKDGGLYGVTAAGGVSNMGTVFVLRSDGSGYRTLKSFVGTDGMTPWSTLLVSSNGTLFGTTYSGGRSNYGTVFKISPSGTGFQVLHEFAGGSDGKIPSGALIEGRDGGIYGMTDSGDSTTRGTIYRVNPAGTGYSVVHAFTGGPDDGQQPKGRLLQTRTGTLFGTATFGGGTKQPGVVFRLEPDGLYWLPHVFGSAGDGSQPSAGLLQASDGMLYGVTARGGAGTVGTVFKMDEYGGNYSVLLSFQRIATDAQVPNSELVEGTDGALYGTTACYGDINSGTVFRLMKDGSGYAVLHVLATSVSVSDFTTPNGLLAGREGSLFGTIQYGGGGPDTGGCAYMLSPLPLPPKILSITLGGGGVSIQSAATSGIYYDLLRSTNLSSWSVLNTVLSPPNGQLGWTNAGSPEPAAFYRLRQH